MLAIFLYSFDAIAPMLITMALGWFIALRKHINESDRNFLNNLCFRYLLAINMFFSTLSIDYRTEFNPRLVFFCIVSIVLIAVAAWVLFSLTIKNRERRCLFIMGAFRSNNIIFALPLAASLFGVEGVKPAAMLMPIMIILFNLFCVTTFVYFSQTVKISMAASIKNTIIEIIKNPLIIGSALGIALSLLRVRLPHSLMSGVGIIAGTATPMALVLLGSQINIKNLSGNIKPVIAACLVRLVIVPTIMIPLTIYAGFRGPELGALAIAFSAPCAVSHMVMARNYNIDPPFAAQMVYLSVTLSMVTMFFIIALLRGLKLI